MNPIIDNNSIAASASLRSAFIPSVSTPGCVPADPVHAKDYLCLTQQATDLQALQCALETAPPLDSPRIEALRQALTEGSYQINPQAIAQRMLELDRKLA